MGVSISTSQCADISAYAGLPRRVYLMTLAMLGLVQWRALQLNPLMLPEDFFHGDSCNCLFQRRIFLEEYALVFEHPFTCAPCRNFYSALCPADEMRALERVVGYAAKAVEGAPKTRLDIAR